MIDVAQYIADYMRQVGVKEYSFRTYWKKLANDTILPAGKYYFFDLSKLQDFQINANNIIFFCDREKYYDVAQYSPIFCGQVHIIALDTTKPKEVVVGEADDLPTPLDPVYVMLIEITPK